MPMPIPIFSGFVGLEISSQQELAAQVLYIARTQCFSLTTSGSRATDSKSRFKHAKSLLASTIVPPGLIFFPTLPLIFISFNQYAFHVKRRNNTAAPVPRKSKTKKKKRDSKARFNALPPPPSADPVPSTPGMNVPLPPGPGNMPAPPGLGTFPSSPDPSYGMLCYLAVE
eukprot:1372057-Amorphochlora_amoeboformis.AAC.1